MTSTAPWPDETIARYLNQVGATVDIRSTPGVIAWACGGCPAARDSFPLADTNPDRYGGYDLHNALIKAQQAAQEHAADCRALPRPDAA